MSAMQPRSPSPDTFLNPQALGSPEVPKRVEVSKRFLRHSHTIEPTDATTVKKELQQLHDWEDNRAKNYVRLQRGKTVIVDDHTEKFIENSADQVPVLSKNQITDLFHARCKDLQIEAKDRQCEKFIS